MPPDNNVGSSGISCQRPKSGKTNSQLVQTSRFHSQWMEIALMLVFVLFSMLHNILSTMFERRFINSDFHYYFMSELCEALLDHCKYHECKVHISSCIFHKAGRTDSVFFFFFLLCRYYSSAWIGGRSFQFCSSVGKCRNTTKRQLGLIIQTLLFVDTKVGG